eukprot:CAMPEP_0202900488 /NCGR_PEP_ID=MMETSP1392-20130828/11861_1 /ASSEMBLY_ACC=CAM_ASM_000868 /TAXON_ID=225041 /ORGANISM="Chlamydomonas chlamydogama, Strain SAG 11-48b" /LENGTH=291 /DNA_ID=CAMNT_0049586885 /DNA_START=187 /DNA_END=1064 /DNA_ORIENTATION=+
MYAHQCAMCQGHCCTLQTSSQAYCCHDWCHRLAPDSPSCCLIAAWALTPGPPEAQVGPQQAQRQWAAHTPRATTLPGIGPEHSQHIGHEDEGEALPDKGQDDVHEGDSHKEQVERVLLPGHALLGPEGGDGEHPDGPHPEQAWDVWLLCGKMMLNDRSPPTAIAIHAWYSKTSYSRDPLVAGFFFAVELRGANVAAVCLANFEISFSRSTSGLLVDTSCTGCVDVAGPPEFSELNLITDENQETWNDAALLNAGLHRLVAEEARVKGVKVDTCMVSTQYTMYSQTGVVGGW